MSDFILDLASGDVYTKKLDGEASRRHLIACADRYLGTHPGGYNADGGVSEADIGSELWSLAQVSAGFCLPIIAFLFFCCCCLLSIAPCLYETVLHLQPMQRLSFVTESCR